MKVSVRVEEMPKVISCLVGELEEKMWKCIKEMKEKGYRVKEHRLAIWQSDCTYNAYTVCTIIFEKVLQ